MQFKGVLRLPITSPWFIYDMSCPPALEMVHSELQNLAADLMSLGMHMYLPWYSTACPVFWCAASAQTQLNSTPGPCSSAHLTVDERCHSQLFPSWTCHYCWGPSGGRGWSHSVSAARYSSPVRPWRSEDHKSLECCSFRTGTKWHTSLTSLEYVPGILSSSNDSSMTLTSIHDLER